MKSVAIQIHQNAINNNPLNPITYTNPNKENDTYERIEDISPAFIIDESFSPQEKEALNLPESISSVVSEITQEEKTDIPPEIEYYSIPAKVKNCPYDQSTLNLTRVPAWKNTTNTIKTLMMLTCPECRRSFYARGSNQIPWTHGL